MGRRTNTDESYKVCEVEEDGGTAGELGEISGELTEEAVAFDVPDVDVTEDEPCVFVYLGPTIRGVITNGGIFTGTKPEILKRFEKGVEKFPQIRRLIIADRNLAKAREMLANGEGAISVAYKKLAESINKEV